MSQPQPLRGLTVVVTGASSGIGRVTALRLAEEGARIAVVGRDPERTGAVALAAGGTAFTADFTRLSQVRRLAAGLQALEHIDVLVNNAGGIMPRRRITADHNESTFQVNHLAPFLLTNLLLDSPAGQGIARVVSTASAAHRYGRLRLDDLRSLRGPWLGGWPAYGGAKLATVLFIRELARRTRGTVLRAYAVHPGVVVTGFGRHVPAMRWAGLLTGGRYARSAADGAGPLIALAEAGSEAPSGSYFDRYRPGAGLARRATGPAADRLAVRLWEASARLTGLGETAGSPAPQ